MEKIVPQSSPHGNFYFSLKQPLRTMERDILDAANGKKNAPFFN